MECEIVGFGIRNSTRGIRNPSNDWNLHSNCHCYGVQIALVKFSAVPAKNLTQVMAFRFLTCSVNRSPKRTNIQPVENLSSICPVPCERRLHLNLVQRNLLFQKFTFLSIFLQNILTSLIAVKHSILSEWDDVKSGSAAWGNTRKKSAISVQREVALFVVILGQIILDADYLLVERNWARIVLNKRALNHRGRLPRIGLYIFLFGRAES